VAIGTNQGRLFDLISESTGTNGQPRIVIAVLSAARSSWYFNLAGEAKTVEVQKPAFLEFLKSVTMDATAATTAEARCPRA
jgi:hypothetical protein